jgi:hypothetical protein
MRNDGRIAERQLTTEQGDSRYHLRLLGVLAVLVERDVWQEALLIADLLTEEARTGTERSGKVAKWA